MINIIFITWAYEIGIKSDVLLLLILGGHFSTLPDPIDMIANEFELLTVRTEHNQSKYYLETNQKLGRKWPDLEALPPYIPPVSSLFSS